MPPIDLLQVRSRAAALADVGDTAATLAAIHALITDYAEPVRRFNPRPVGGGEADFRTPLPVLRTIVNVWRRTPPEPQAALELARGLWAADSRQERRLAAELLGLVAPQAAEDVLMLIEGWLAQIESGETADALAEYGLGPLMLADPPAYLARARQWVLHHHKWTRRFGVAALLPLARDKQWNDLPRALDILRLVMTEPEIEVRKIVVTVLRELIPHSPVEMARFLRDQSVRPNHNTHWIVRAAMVKLPQADQTEIMRILRT